MGNSAVATAASAAPRTDWPRQRSIVAIGPRREEEETGGGSAGRPARAGGGS